MNIFKPFLVTLLITVFCSFTEAQQKPVPKLTPPELQSFWSNTKGGHLPLENVLAIIDSAVWVMDVKKNKYFISRFILLYRSKDKYEDEQTGEIKTRFNSNSTQVRNAPVLEEKWRKFLYENIKPGDEVWISDIIVRDKKGEYYKAPDVKVVIE